MSGREAIPRASGVTPSHTSLAPARSDVRELVDHARRASQARAPRLREIVEVSQPEVLQVGDLLRDVREESEQQVADLDALNRHVMGTGAIAGSPSLRSSADEQDEAYGAFSAFCDETEASLGEQAGCAREAAGNAHQIVSVAQRVGRLGNTARMVALNARVESSRLGDAGAPFAVLAVEIRALTDSILDLSEEIETLGVHLTSAIPRIAENAGRLVASHRLAGGKLKERLGRVMTAQRASLEVVEHTAGAGHTRADRIVVKLQQVLERLQFQDQIAQNVHAVVHQDAASLALLEQELARIESGAPRPHDFAKQAERAEYLSRASTETERATRLEQEDALGAKLSQGEAVFF